MTPEDRVSKVRTLLYSGRKSAVELAEACRCTPGGIGLTLDLLARRGEARRCGKSLRLNDGYAWMLTSRGVDVETEKRWEAA
jgi:hypothetical protein